jgi:hypothetical protein
MERLRIGKLVTPGVGAPGKTLTFTLNLYKEDRLWII